MPESIDMSTDPYLCLAMLCFASQAQFLLWLFGTTLGLALMLWSWR